MRMYNPAGMDTPSDWETGELCVEEGFSYILLLRSILPLSSDVDQVRAVAWWYDRTIEEGGTSADIDLYLQNCTGSTTYTADESYDTKARVYMGPDTPNTPGGKCLRVRISGTSVPVNTPECGNNAILVYYAWLYEDLDRDDPEGPPADIE